MKPEEFGKVIGRFFKFKGKRFGLSNEGNYIGAAASATALALAGRGVVSGEDIQASFLTLLVYQGVAKPKNLSVPNLSSEDWMKPGQARTALRFGRKLLRNIESGQETLVPIRKGKSKDRRRSKKK